MVVELSLWTGVGGTLKKTTKEAANAATPSTGLGGQGLWASSAPTPGTAALPCTSTAGTFDLNKLFLETPQAQKYRIKEPQNNLGQKGPKDLKDHQFQHTAMGKGPSMSPVCSNQVSEGITEHLRL